MRDNTKREESREAYEKLSSLPDISSLIYAQFSLKFCRTWTSPSSSVELQLLPQVMHVSFETLLLCETWDSNISCSSSSWQCHVVSLDNDHTSETTTKSTFSSSNVSFCRQTIAGIHNIHSTLLADWHQIDFWASIVSGTSFHAFLTEYTFKQ